jgi:NTE family protein
MNAAVVAHGLTLDRNDGARAALRRFWDAIADQGAASFMKPSWIDRPTGRGNLDFSPGWIMLDNLARMFSPYQLNPANHHPLRDILSTQIDFERLRHSQKVKLFVGACNVMTNRLRVFDLGDMSVDAVLASACLPSLFQAVEIDGEHYWDGGYLGNPPNFPVNYNCSSADVVLIMINPIQIDRPPRNAQAIPDRIHTLSLNSSHMREMRAIAFFNRLVAAGFDDGGRLKRVLVHRVDAEVEMRGLGASSKYNTELDFLRWLFELGRDRGAAFLDEHFETLGRESSTSDLARPDTLLRRGCPGTERAMQDRHRRPRTRRRRAMRLLHHFHHGMMDIRFTGE